MQLGHRLAALISGGTVIAFEGDLGAGKTTLIQGILEGLGTAGPYTSPTFVIMKQYAPQAPSRSHIQRVYHTDAYRIGTQEMLSLGWEEWIEDDKGLLLVEWPSRIADIIPDDACIITLEWIDETHRTITIENAPYGL